MTQNGNTAGFGVGIVVGAAIGLAIGFLYAPRPGSETRALIRERAEKSKDKAEEIIEEARVRAKKIVDDAKGKAAELQEKPDEKA